MIDRLLIDTNAVIYSLQGVKHVNQLLNGQRLVISFITEIELFSWPNIKTDDELLISKFISDCEIIECSSKLKSRVISVRKNYKLKMSDAFVAATAIEHNLPLISADLVFSKINEINYLKIKP